jgi:hypothetical protein
MVHCVLHSANCPQGCQQVLVSRVGSSFTLRLRQDGIGVLGPDERFAALVPSVDEAADGIDEFTDGVEAAAADGLAGDDPEEDPC